MTQKMMVTLSAVAVAGLAALGLKRTLGEWHKRHLKFEFPLEEQLFIGWGSGNPRKIKQA